MRRRSIGRVVLVNLLVLVGLLVVGEGIASYVLLVHSMAHRVELAERKHTRYDPDLGWVSIPNLHVPDMYGPGVSLRTNGQGFRNDRDIPPHVPPGKYRVICSGDSFTLGYGVADDQTWCARLAVLDPRLETVNMGQGGYGVDQAYLWFKRDAAGLQHHVQVFAFITHDFFRMHWDTFFGFGKPIVRVENGALRTANVPVPRTAYRLGWLAPRLRPLEDLRSIQFVRLALRRIGLMAPAPEGMPRAETQAAAAKIFEELRDLNARRASRLVLVHLAYRDGLPETPEDTDWVRFVHDTAARLGVPLLDVQREFRRLSRDEVAPLFLPDGHLSGRGNEVVAEMICRAVTAALPADAASAATCRSG